MQFGVSVLRFAGMVIAVFLLGSGARRIARAGSGSRVPGIVRLVIGLALLAVAIWPDLVRPLQDVLGLEGAPLGRLVTVLIVAVAAGYLLLLHALGRAERANQRLSLLVRSQAVARRVGQPGEHWGGILVCIAAFNEAETLPPVLAGIPENVAGLAVNVLVIDDGSQDATAAQAQLAGAHVVRHLVNCGQGAALQTGYVVAQEVQAEIVVTMDADGQHDPAELAGLVGPIIEDRADFVVGSRRLGAYATESRARNAGVTVFTRLVNLLGGTRVSDIANGFRAVRVSRLVDLRFIEDQFHNPELVIRAARAGLRVAEAPVTIRLRASGTTKKGGNLRYGLGFLRVMLKTWLE